MYIIMDRRASFLGHFEILQVLSAYGADFSINSIKTTENAAHFATIAYKLLCIRFIGQRGTVLIVTIFIMISFNVVVGCPTNEVNSDGLTPQKIAKNEGTKDAMKELKKLSGFQDKVSRGTKPKGYAEPWSIRVSIKGYNDVQLLS